jgi:hypothetical protein
MSAAEMIGRLTAAGQKLSEAQSKAAAAAQDANEARTSWPPRWRVRRPANWSP